MKPKTALLAVVIVFLAQEAFSTRLNLIKTMIRNKRNADDCQISGGIASHCTSLGAARAHFLSGQLNTNGPGKKRSSLNLQKLQRMKTSGRTREKAVFFNPSSTNENTRLRKHRLPSHAKTMVAQGPGSAQGYRTREDWQ